MTLSIKGTLHDSAYMTLCMTLCINGTKHKFLNCNAQHNMLNWDTQHKNYLTFIKTLKLSSDVCLFL
jgi:hypothetical protein